MDAQTVAAWAANLDRTVVDGWGSHPGVFPAIVRVYRAGGVVAQFLVDDTTLTPLVAGLAARRSDPDLLSVTTDTYVPTTAHHPATGAPWLPGDLGTWAAEHPGHPAVADALVCLAVDREGAAAAATHPYRRDDASTVTWLEATDLAGDDTQRAGTMAGLYVEAMLAPKEPPGAGSRVVAAARADVAVAADAARALGRAGGTPVIAATFFAAPGSPRHQELVKLVDKRAVVDPRKLGPITAPRT